jgi:hypothetical protein
MKGNLHLSLNRPDLAVTDFRGAQELKSDLRSYQGYCVWSLVSLIVLFKTSCSVSKYKYTIRSCACLSSTIQM